MIDVDQLNYATKIPNVKVEPANELFSELGNNTYDFLDLVSEFVDNSIAAMDGVPLQVEIEIGISEENRDQSYLLIRDNAAGIPVEKLGTALSPGAMAGGNTLNEHGLGMKQAIAALGQLKYIATKTVEDNEAVIIDELRFGDILPKSIHVEWVSGTEICVDRLKPIVPRASQRYTKTVSHYLGARYRRYLKSANPQLDLRIALLDLDDLDDAGHPAAINIWKIDEVKPDYFHPHKRRNEPVLSKHQFDGEGWQAELTLGYAPTNEEYEHMGLEPPKSYEPYKVGIGKQGLDIIRNNRVIRFHQLSEIDLVPSRHNRYNHIRGEIDLKKGFTTAITKNFIVQDIHFQELIFQLNAFFDENRYLENKTYPDEIPEVILRDRLAKHFKNRAIDPKHNVNTEVAVQGLGGFIDILADGEAWELKINPADGLDVYQLFAYLDMGDFPRGYLVASAWKSGAHAAVNFIKDNHNKEIVLVPRSDLPINDPLTQDEIKRFF